MGVVAEALNSLQGETSAYLGCLLPIVARSISRLEELSSAKDSNLVHCQPLLGALLEGINKRWGTFLLFFHT
jgi:hypothetical protein